MRCAKSKLREHVPGHEIPDGLEVTLPDPSPPTETRTGWGGMLKTALTCAESSRVTSQGPVPSQTSLNHPPKAASPSGVAVKVTTVPAG